MTDGILEQSKEITKFYYEAQQYFRSLGLMCKTVGKYVIDKGFTILSKPGGNLQHLETYEYLPSNIRVVFKLTQNQKETFAFCIWFFSEDPDSFTPWLPFGFICKAILKEESDWQYWPATQCIADYIRPLMINPTLENTYIRYSDSGKWPEKLTGLGIDELASLEVVPFLLAAIKNSRDLEDLINPVITKLEQGIGHTLKDDNNYVNRFLGITVIAK